MSKELISIDLPKYDIHLLLASLKIAEIHNGDQQHWEIAKNVGKLHALIQKQVFNYERV